MAYTVIDSGNSITDPDDSPANGAFHLGVGDNLLIQASGYILATGATADAIFLGGNDDGGILTVNGFVSATEYGIYSLGTAAHITVSGEVSGRNVGVYLANGGNLYVSPGGLVTGGSGVNLVSNSALYNDGTVHGDGNQAIQMSYGTIVNNGLISSRNTAIFFGAEGVGHVTNTGSIQGSLDTYFGASDPTHFMSVDNSGRWIGSIGLTPGDDSVTNTGTIIGSIFLGDGADSYDGSHGGVLDGAVSGGGGVDLLQGGSGNEVFDGGAGDDVMAGGSGNDVYVVDSAKDQVIEDAGGGTDSVYAMVDWVLPSDQQIEKILSLGSGLTLEGNALANAVTGDGGDNALYGAGGDDVLKGMGGADSLYGGEGNDAFYVTDATAKVVEDAGGGTDVVYTTVNYTLTGGQEIEKLATMGSSTTYAVNLTGNEMNNSLVGNAAANVLNGGGGADSLYGYAGNDAYYVDNAADKVFERTAEGTDTVYASVSYTLQAGSDIEKLSTLGSSTTTHINLTGNELNNTISGNAAGNVITGGVGADVLYGYAGADSFTYVSLADSTNSSGARDTIQDFNASQHDRIDLHLLDANTATSGDQAFSFIGASGFTGTAGQLHYVVSGTSVIVSGDVNGDSVADFSISVAHVASLAATDFVL